jgi:hypothetical protein
VKGTAVSLTVEKRVEQDVRLNTIECKHEGLEREHNILTREHRVHHGGGNQHP